MTLEDLGVTDDDYCNARVYKIPRKFLFFFSIILIPLTVFVVCLTILSNKYSVTKENYDEIYSIENIYKFNFEGITYVNGAKIEIANNQMIITYETKKLKIQTYYTRSFDYIKTVVEKKPIAKGYVRFFYSFFAAIMALGIETVLLEVHMHGNIPFLEYEFLLAKKEKNFKRKWEEKVKKKQELEIQKKVPKVRKLDR